MKLNTSQQGTIFDSFESDAQRHIRFGYTADVVCHVCSISYRQLDYWTRTNLIQASVNRAFGSGNRRLYNFQDIVFIRLIKSLLDTGVTLQKVKTAVLFLRKNQVDLKSTILVSDGKNIYATNRGEDVSYLLSSGQGVFGLSIGHVYSHLEKSLDVMRPDSALKFKLRKAI